MVDCQERYAEVTKNLQELYGAAEGLKAERTELQTEQQLLTQEVARLEAEVQALSSDNAAMQDRLEKATPPAVQGGRVSMVEELERMMMKVTELVHALANGAEEGATAGTIVRDYGRLLSHIRRYADAFGGGSHQGQESVCLSMRMGLSGMQGAHIVRARRGLKEGPPRPREASLG